MRLHPISKVIEATHNLPFLFLLLLVACVAANAGSSSASGAAASVPADIQAVFNKPVYRNAIWGLRVVDPGTGSVLVDLRPDHQFFIGSVRKIFSVGALLEQIGPQHTYDTRVYRQGQMDSGGILHGDLILVASGDLTMGGRTNPDGSVAISDYDHNEADSLGNAKLTAPDPLAGYLAIAKQVAAKGIKQITGDIVIDDRLFQPYSFRSEFDLKPIFVNDDVVDLTINPTTNGNPASVVWRPHSAALNVQNAVTTSGPGSRYSLQLNSEFPKCIGMPGCSGQIGGNLPLDFVPPFTNQFPLVQTFRIVQPSNYARSVLIETLQAAGVRVGAAPVAQNPVQLLPPRNSYQPDVMVANLTGLPFSEDAKLVLKVSYNMGADTSLLLYGLTQGVDNMTAALAAEQTNLAANYGVPKNEYVFVDGSGGGPTTATNSAVTQFLIDMTGRATFPVFFDALPVLSVDGSLSFVTGFKSDSTLAGAAGRVHAKTGTFVSGSSSGLLVKGQALGGYINTRSGKRLVFQLVVNNVPVTSLNDVIQVFQDQGKISAILWRDN
jgi:PBP4 family serine-type D-alanyl-D-alanine carboxypeptidase